MTTNDDVLTGGGFATISVASLLADSARRWPDSTALIWAGGPAADARVTYADLWRQTRAVAGVLRSRGVRRGDRVAIMVPNVPDFARAYYAVLAIGAVAVPIHLLFKREEIEHVLRDSGASQLIVAATSLAEALPAAGAVGVPAVSVLVPDEQRDAVPIARMVDLVTADDATPIERIEPMNPLEPATVLYTSGTTGTPKGAVNSHFALIEQVNVSIIDLFDLQHDDVVFGGLPLFHTFGQTCVLNTTFRRGGTIVLLPRFEPAAAMAAMVEHGATVFTAVPTMYVGLMAAARSGAALPKLRYGISGGAPLPVALLEAFQSTFGVDVYEGYGLTETSPVVSFNRVGEPIHPGTVGRPIWGVEVVVADPSIDDRIEPLAVGELGEICVRGHDLFMGYLHNEAATAQSVVDGWFRTGDLGTMDDDDLVTIVDRKKDMIVRNGYNVYPTEVEGVLVRHPAVLTAAVYGVPHEVHGQEIEAAVVLVDGQVAEPAELIAFVQEKIAAYKYPRVVHLTDAFPLGPSGKVLKRVLSAQSIERAASVGRADPAATGSAVPA